MASRKRKKTETYNIATMQPDEINELRKVVVEYTTRKKNIQNELELLKDDLKELDDEFSDKLDLKHLKLAEKQLKLQQGVAHKDTFDLFLEAMEGDVNDSNND